MSKDTTLQQRPHITLLIGNPGTGKSALLNALTGGANFKSGISLGRGVTQVHKIYKKTETEWFADTPGFDDVEMRKQAAAEIERALKLNADYTICFVVTLESGRLRPTDLSTMQLVLEAINLPNGTLVKFGVVVNKLEQEVRKLFEDPETLKVFCAQLNLNGSGNFFTDSIFLCDFSPDLQGKSNVVPPRNVDLEQFLFDLPTNAIDQDNVQHIEYDKMEKLSKEHEEKTQKLMKDKEFLKGQLSILTDNAKRFESQLSDLERKNRDLNARKLELTSKSKGFWDYTLQLADSLVVVQQAKSVLRLGMRVLDAVQNPDPQGEQIVPILLEEVPRILSGK